jgi:DNA helicase-2/ATP-dependent DNA helicase PcrA
MPKPVVPGTAAAALIAEETALWQRVVSFLLAQVAAAENEKSKPTTQHDQELIELRDAISEAKPEDLAPLVEQMARVAAVAANRRGKVVAPVDIATPYFAHLRLRPSVPPKAQARDVLIGRRGLIDRAAGIQIVDWRDAPVSQMYYRYEEGDDYDETIGWHGVSGRHRSSPQHHHHKTASCGASAARKASTSDGNDDVWWEADSQILPDAGWWSRSGGADACGSSAQRCWQGGGATKVRMLRRPAAGSGLQLGDAADSDGSFVGRADKHLPEIAALIDRHQFDLITEPDSGVVVIQGGAGSGKTTVALHRWRTCTSKSPSAFEAARSWSWFPAKRWFVM